MTDVLEPPLEFTRNLAEAMQSYVIGAFSKPLPASDPLSTYRYLNSRRDMLQESARQQPLVRMQDKNYNQLARIGSEMSCYFEEIAADSGEAGVVIRGGDYLGDFVRNAVRIEEDLHLSIDPNPTQPSWKTRWGGKITTINVKRDSSGIHTVELIATSNREHLKTTLVGATPLFPPEIQPIKMFFLPANCRTACSVTMWINLLRQFDPIASIPTNIFNPAGWINPLSPDALLNLLPTEWPIQVQFINPLLDQSRTTLLAGAWTDFHSTTVDILKDAGCTARVYTYFTEDEDNPHPELEAVIGNELADFARPQRNALVCAFEDHSGYGGPTGTLADGVINLFASTLDDLITTTVFPVDADDDGEIDPVFRKLFLVAPPPPWAAFREGQESGIIESNYSQHKGPVKTSMTGGRSPQIVNDLQTFFIRYGISQLAQVISLGPAGAYETPGIEGMDNLYQGQLDNCVASDTIVEGPQGNCRIDELARYGGEFRVWSLTPAGQRVSATAVRAFKKGRAELFEYELDDGRTIKTTGQHRFLTAEGYRCGADVEVGSQFATVDHADLSPKCLDVLPQWVEDQHYERLPEAAALQFRKVVGIQSLGVDDFYDMHVPGWENYSANGVWNHNTLLAWQRYTNPLRALYTGDMGFLEHFERPGGSAYTLSAVLTLRQSDWKKRAYRSFKTSIRNAAPYIMNYDLLLDDRVMFEQDGIQYVDQISAFKYEYDRDKPITWTVSVGDDSKDTDPFAQGIRALQAVYTLVGAILGEGSIFD